MSDARRREEPHPWRVPVVIDTIPDTGLVLEFVATPEEREAMRKLAGLRELSDAHARFELAHAGQGRVRAAGRVTARIGQNCVVTLEPIDSEIDEPVEALFVPEADVESVSRALDRAAEEAGEMADPPEPIVGGTIDLGKLAADGLFLAIDPYPRKPDARFEAREVAEDPEDHPFAALKALKDNSPKSGKD